MERILELLDKQLKIEKGAITMYDSLLEKELTLEIKEVISSIRESEVEHVKLVEEMIGLAKPIASDIKAPEEKAVKILPAGFIEQYSSLFLLVNLEKHASVIIDVLKERRMRCVYISVNKLPKYIKKLVGDHGIDVNSIRFIAATKGSGEGEIQDPENLTELSISISQAISESKEKQVVIIDAVSDFSTYHSNDKISEFLSFINSKISNLDAGIIWLSMDNDSQKELNEKLSPLCDKMLKA